AGLDPTRSAPNRCDAYGGLGRGSARDRGAVESLQRPQARASGNLQSQCLYARDQKCACAVARSLADAGRERRTQGVGVERCRKVHRFLTLCGACAPWTMLVLVTWSRLEHSSLRGGRPMLLKLSDQVSECLRRAEEAGRRARTAIDARSIEHYLKMEQRWLFLARSRQFQERVERFLG